MQNLLQNNNTTTTSSSSSFAWVAIALFACVATATMVVLLKYIGTCVSSCANTKSERMHMLLLFMTGYIAFAGVVCACVIAYLAASGNAVIKAHDLYDRMCRDRRLLLGMFAMGAIVVLCQTGIILSVNAAPNPGYAHLIINMNVVIVLVVSIYLFGSLITPTAWVGVVLAVLGIMLVVAGASHKQGHVSDIAEDARW